MTRVAVLADTHLPGRRREIPAKAWELIDAADLTLHAGDVVSPTVLHELAGHGPLHVAMGNCDLADVRAWGAQDVVALLLEAVKVVMLHDAGAAQGRAARLARRFPDAGLVVFGHSHLPLLEYGLGGMLLLNPGSPTDRRRAPHHTMAMVDLAEGRATAEIVALD